MAAPFQATYDPSIEHPPIIHEHNSTKMWLKISTILILTVAVLSLLYWYIKALRQRQRQRQHQRQQHGIHFIEMTAVLPKRIHHASGNMEEDRLECSICLEEYQDEEELVELPGCQHLFHPRCIENALRMKQECPVCRSQLEG